MEFRPLRFNYVIVQILRKALRRHELVFMRERRKQKSKVYLMERIINSEKSLKIRSLFTVKTTFHPPSEAYMYFPVGKAPSFEQSIVFVAYIENNVAGWAWLHKGVRKDTMKAHDLKIYGDVVWFGPDYVRPKFRGKSLQKVLIKERLNYIYKRLPGKKRQLTLIAENNKASLKSYLYFNFVKVYEK